MGVDKRKMGRVTLLDRLGEAKEKTVMIDCVA
jgi:hypothetical protein